MEQMLMMGRIPPYHSGRPLKFICDESYDCHSGSDNYSFPMFCGEDSQNISKEVDSEISLHPLHFATSHAQGFLNSDVGQVLGPFTLSESSGKSENFLWYLPLTFWSFLMVLWSFALSLLLSVNGPLQIDSTNRIQIILLM